MRKIFLTLALFVTIFSTFSFALAPSVYAACINDWTTVLTVNKNPATEGDMLQFTINRGDIPTFEGFVYIIFKTPSANIDDYSDIFSVKFSEGSDTVIANYNNPNLVSGNYEVFVTNSDTDIVNGQCSPILNLTVNEPVSDDSGGDDDTGETQSCVGLNGQCIADSILCEPNAHECVFTNDALFGVVRAKQGLGCTQFYLEYPNEDNSSNYVDFSARGCNSQYTYFVAIEKAKSINVNNPAASQFERLTYINLYMSGTGGNAEWITPQEYTFHSSNPGLYRAILVIKDPADSSKYINVSPPQIFVIVEDLDEETDEEATASGFLIGYCEAENGSDYGVPTAFGCIDISSQSANLAILITIGIGVSGGIAMLIIMYSAFLIMTSQGEPQRLAKGRELLFSAIIGIITISLSTLIIRVLGGTLLGLF